MYLINFSGSYELYMHYDIVHGGLSEYECDHCHMKFTELANLKKHIVFNHPISDQGSKYKLCQICNVGMAYTEAKFTQHLLSEHFPHIHRQLQNMPYPRDELTLRQNIVISLKLLISWN